MSEAPKPPEKMHWLGKTITIAFVLCLAFVILAIFGTLLDDPVTHELLVGWYALVTRAWHSRGFDVTIVVRLLWSVPLMLAGGHLLLSWISREWQRARGEESPTPWKLRWTLKFVGLTAVLVVAGMLAWGVAEQVRWLVTTRERIVEPARWRTFDLPVIQGTTTGSGN